MSYRAGSEEFYRGGPSRLPQPVYNRDTLDLLRQNAGTALDLQERQRAMDDRHTESIRGDIKSGVDNFHRSMERGEQQADRRAERERSAKRFQTEEQTAQEQSQVRQQQIKSQAQEMERNQKEYDFKYTPTASGKTRAEEEYDRQVADAALSRRYTEAQIAAMGTSNKTTQTEANVEKLAQVMTGALQTGDQAALANLKAQGASMGLSEMDIQRAQLKAQQTISSGAMAKDLHYAGTIEGQVAQQDLVDLAQKTRAFQDFQAAAKRYKESSLGGLTEQGEIALDEMRAALREMGESEENINRAWYGGREGKIDQVVSEYQNKLRNRLELARTASQGGGQGMQRSFQNAEAAVSKVAPGAAPVDIFSGQILGQGQRTGMMNVLMGGAQQQQPAPRAPMAPPASVQNVNSALSRGQNPSTQGLSRFNRQGGQR